MGWGVGMGGEGAPARTCCIPFSTHGCVTAGLLLTLCCAWTQEGLAFGSHFPALPLPAFPQDVVAACPSDSKLTWFETVAGAPPTWVARNVQTGINGVKCGIATDLDSDGDTDVSLIASFL